MATVVVRVGTFWPADDCNCQWLNEPTRSRRHQTYCMALKGHLWEHVVAELQVEDKLVAWTRCWSQKVRSTAVPSVF